MKRRLLFLILSISLIYFITISIYSHTSYSQGDGAHYLVISQTLLKYHSLNVMLDYNNDDYRSFYIGHLIPHISANTKGQLLPIHGIGGPILWFIPFLIMGRTGVHLFMSFLCVLVIYNVYKIFTGKGVNKKTSAFLCFIFAIASHIYIYSHLAFIEPIGTLITVYAFRIILFPDKLNKKNIFISSLSLGLLPWIHIRFIAVEIPLFFLLLWEVYRKVKPDNYSFKREKTIKYFLILFLPIILLSLSFEYYNYEVWGSLNPAQSLLNQGIKTFQVSPFPNMLSMLLDQEFGLLINYPMFILLFAGFFLSVKDRLYKINIQIFSISFPYILIFTSYVDWKGGWTPPARYILILSPLLYFYIGYLFKKINSIYLRIYFILLAMPGFMYNIIAVFSGYHGFNGNKDLIGKNDIFFHIGKIIHLNITDYLPSAFIPKQTNLFLIWIVIICLLNLLPFFFQNMLKRTDA